MAAREYPENGTVEYTAKIPKPMYEEFIGFFPQYGSNSWFIRGALENLLELCRQQPRSVDLLRAAIESTVRNS